VPVAQRLSHLPVIVDPSHSGGRRDLGLPLSRAAIAVGADGITTQGDSATAPLTPETPWIWLAKRGVLLGAVLLGGQGELLGQFGGV
jgi:hypothetical protein